jgi:uridine monophosphate synthetase
VDFFTLLGSSIEAKDSLLCVGIDPQGIAEGGGAYENLLGFGAKIIESTSAAAACFKPNIAFYEAYGPDGLRALKEIILQVPAGTPVILDAKRGDIGNTAKAYARSAFDDLEVHAVTLNPYLGRESAEPFLERREKGLFLLCRTSNPGSAAIQDLGLRDRDIPFYLYVADLVLQWGENVGLVVGANMPRELRRIRERHPDAWILAPGIGAQGGDIGEAVRSGIGRDGTGMLLSASRSIAGAESPGEAARKLRDEINRARKGKVYAVSGSAETAEKEELALGLIRLGCFQTGRFTLKSGKISPIYLDLRLLISDPALLRRAAAAYSSLMAGLDFQRVAGIPFAGVPLAAAAALHGGWPMIFPRLTAKGHGSGRSVEGHYERGEKVVLLDDLITTGKSKLEAAEVLKGAGLLIEDLVVLVERGRQGRADMEEAGIRLHSYLSIEELLDVCCRVGKIDKDELAAIRAFLQKDS